MDNPGENARGSDARPASRRGMLRAVLGGAVAVSGAAVLAGREATPAGATGNEGPTTFSAGSDTVTVLGSKGYALEVSTAPDGGILVTQQVGGSPAVSVTSGQGPAGSSSTGIQVSSPGLGDGVDATSTYGDGVAGTNSSGRLSSGVRVPAGVRGSGNQGAYGVIGNSDTGVAVEGTSAGYIGVNGISNSSHSGVAGFSAMADGVHGIGKTAGFAGVWGENAGGYGGRFEGGAAAVRLIPTSSVGAPTSGSHAVGELVVDQAGSLFICIAAGTPGTWKRVLVG